MNYDMETPKDELLARISELEKCCIDKTNKLILMQDKLHRRNLQIKDLKKNWHPEIVQLISDVINLCENSYNAQEKESAYNFAKECDKKFNR
jgi:hypothetical protein